MEPLVAQTPNADFYNLFKQFQLLQKKQQKKTPLVIVNQLSQI